MMIVSGRHYPPPRRHKPEHVLGSSKHWRPDKTVLALMLAVFVTSAGYGVILPLLPDLIGSMGDRNANPAWVSRNTGLVTGIYTLALFMFAGRWGRLSDRYGRRPFILAGLIGLGVSMMSLSLSGNLPLLYAGRFLSGAFAAAITPIASAVIGDRARSEEMRVRQLTLLSLANVAGFLLGPMLGAFVARVTAAVPGQTGASTLLAGPLAVMGLLAWTAAFAVGGALAGPNSQPSAAARSAPPSGRGADAVRTLLFLSFVASAAIGIFEVGLTLRGRQQLALSPYQIATAFMECSLVMFAVQTAVFSPRVKPQITRWLITPALAALSLSLLLVPLATGFISMLIAVSLFAGSGGLLSPVLTYWISSKAGRAQGAELGRQAAISSLGQALGSGLGGLVFGASTWPEAPLLLITSGTIVALLLSLKLPTRLAPKDRVAVAVEAGEQ